MDTPCIGGNLMNVPEHRRCGAKTRDGDPCKNWGIPPSGRCRMHGGRSLRWFASPRWVHGQFSRYGFEATLARADRQRAAIQVRAERIVAAEREVREAREARKAKRRPSFAWSDEILAAVADMVNENDA